MKEEIPVGIKEGIDIYSLEAIPFYFVSLIRVHPCESLVPNLKHKKKSRRAFHPRVWCWDGNALPRCMTAQPGGMSADILLAHNIAAAKVRWQSL
jgi:hypothetical protein